MADEKKVLARFGVLFQPSSKPQYCFKNIKRQRTAQELWLGHTRKLPEMRQMMNE